jgi:hemin uptake protein HemP
LLRFYEPILIPEDLKSSPDKNSIKTRPISKDKWMNLFPNPAQQYVIVEYNCSGLSSDSRLMLELSISTFDGKLIESKTLYKPYDQILVDTKGYSSGLYLISLKQSGKIINSRKVTIIR